MLAQLAAQTDPALGGLGRRFDSRGAKVGLAAGVGVGAMGSCCSWAPSSCRRLRLTPRPTFPP